MCKIVYWHDYGISGDIRKNTLRKALNKMGPEYFDAYIIIRKADMLGQSDYKEKEKKQLLEEIIRMHDEIILSQDALSLKDLKIGGQDLIELGVKKGPVMGEILKALLERVMDDPELNEREKLVNLVKNEYARELLEDN